MRLSFGQQALLLVSVPLIFEIAFVSLLAIVLKGVEAQKNAAEQSRDIMLSSENLAHSLYEVGQALFMYAPTKSDIVLHLYQQRLTSAKQNLATLSDLLAKSGRYTKDSKEIDTLGTQLLDLLEVVSSSISQGAIAHSSSSDEGDVSISGFNVPHSSIPLDSTVFDQIAFDTKQLNARVKLVGAAERQRSEETPRTERKMRQLLELIFWLGLALSVLIAIGLTVYFDRRTTSRLKILVANTDRLARGQSLLPEFGGRDEIAQLDNVFHSMATSLSEATERMRSVINYMPLGLVTVTPQGIIESVNPRMYKYFGYESDQVVGKPLTLLFSQPENLEAAAFLNNLKDKAGNRSLEQMARKASGEVFPVQVSCSEFKISEGMRWLLTLEDVTEIREMQRMKEEFTAIISHELRTPLTSVKAFLSGFSLGIYGESKPELLKRVAGIDSSVDRLMRLINDLLDSEKMASGMLTISCSPVDFQEVIASSLHSVREFAESRKVQISVQMCEAAVDGDYDRLVQVMVNLLSNAIKYSPSGGKVEIACHLDDNILRVTIRDRGPGIPEESQSLIFERFHRIESDSLQQKGGTGLGLCLCKYIIEKHGGSIGVESIIGQGSTFWFQLPVL